jgi:hypothetical protein
VLPLGFAVPLIAVPWLALSRRARLAALAGPLAIALLSFAVQTFAYASARQRLPAGFALWIVLAVLASDLAAGRLRPLVRPRLALLAGLLFPAALAAGTARVAVLDQVGWDELLGSTSTSWGERLTGVVDGRAFRPEVLEQARTLRAAVSLAIHGRPGPSLGLLSPLAGRALDLTIDDRQVGVPEYWAARDLLALGRRRDAGRLAAASLETRAEDLSIGALARRLNRATSGPEPPGWRPPGSDPVSVRLATAVAARLDRDPAAARAAMAPLGAAFPELVDALSHP